MKDKEFEQRDYLFDGDKTVKVNVPFLVAQEPELVFNLETVPVSYWYFNCMYNNEPRILEQRIEELSDGSQNIIENIVDTIPMRD